MGKHLAVVTGGSSGIGAALIQQLLLNGPVLNVSRRNLKINESSYPHPLHQLSVDLAEPERASGRLQSWLAAHPELTVNLFFSSAAQLNIDALRSVSVSDFERTFRINAWAPITLTEKCLHDKNFLSEGARFIFLTSSLARNDTALSFARLGLYSASKAALERLVQVQRREALLAGKCIASTVVHPGIVDSAMQETLRGDVACDPAFQEKTRLLPPYRPGDWEDVAPSDAPRTISAQQSAEFLTWIAALERNQLRDYYDYYNCAEFHVQRRKNNANNERF